MVKPCRCNPRQIILSTKRMDNFLRTLPDFSEAAAYRAALTAWNDTPEDEVSIDVSQGIGPMTQALFTYREDDD